MEIERVKEFAVIAEKKSIREAADALSLSAATLSTRLLNFEKSLGVELFIRASNSLTLSEAGERFLPDALTIVNQYERLRAALAVSEETSCDSIRIIIAGPCMPIHLGPFVDTMVRKHPGFRVDYLGNSLPLEEALNSGRADLFIGPVAVSVSYPGIQRFQLASSQQHVFLPAGHRLSGATTLSLADLNDETFILMHDQGENCIADFQLKNLKASGIHYKICETDSDDKFITYLVPSGKGIMLLPYPGDFICPPNSVAIPITDICDPAPTSLFYKRDGLRPDAKGFIDQFKEFVQRATSHKGPKGGMRP